MSSLQKTNVKKVVTTFIIFTVFATASTMAQQVGVKISTTNTDPDSSAMLDIESYDKGILIPRMTTAQRDNINNPAVSLLIYNTTENCLQAYTGEMWQNIWCACLKPHVTAHPTDANADAGGSVSFSITATGTDVSYQWQVRENETGEWRYVGSTKSKEISLAEVKTEVSRTFNKGEVVEKPVPVAEPPEQPSPNDYNYTCEGTNTPVLTISNIFITFSGLQFRAIVTNLCGSDTSNAATLTVNCANPYITTQPANQTIDMGTSTGFSVKADGYGLNLSYQWQLNTGDGNWEDIVIDAGSKIQLYSGATSSILQIISAPYSLNGYLYHCIVTDSCGSVTSGPATLTVNCVAPEIKEQPQNISAKEGGFAYFKVSASGTGLIYQWQVDTGAGNWMNLENGGKLPTYSGVDRYYLEIFDITSKCNGYKYQCVVSNSCSSVTSNPAILTVGCEPPIIAKQSGNVTVKAGENISLWVEATGSNLNYQWQVDTLDGNWLNLQDGGSQPSYLGTKEPKLEIFNYPTNHNGYLYRCVVTNTCGGDNSGIITITVL